MSPRLVLLPSVSAVLLAASVAVSGPVSAATQNPNTLLASAAYKALAVGDTATAISSYSLAIESRELEPEVLANALLNRGLAFQYLGQHDKAVDDYSAALRIDAMSAKLRAMALYNRGVSYQKLRNPVAAIEDFTNALFLDGQFSYAYLSRANLLRESGQYLFALSDYEKALSFKHPEPARVFYGKALTFDAMRRPDDALEALKQALKANPRFEPAKQLATTLAPELAVASVDSVATSTINGAANGVVARKAALPKPEAPATELLGALASEASVSVSNKIVARVPAEETDSAAVAQLAANASSLGEKIVAIEPVAEPVPAENKVADVEPVAEAPPAAAGWSVQIASASSEGGAWSTWKRMKAKHRALSDKKATVMKADLGAKGTFYRVRLTGYEKQSDAKSACSKLKSQGVTCYVSKASS